MKMIFCCFTIAIFSLFLTSAYAEDVNSLLLVKWGDLDGDAIESGYEDYSYATEVSMGISNDCSPFPPNQQCDKFLDGFVITKYASSLGVELAKYCANGQLFTEKIIIVSLIPTKNLVPLWKITLDHTIISKIASAMDSTTGRLMEAIELLPHRIKWEFYTYSEKGMQTGYSCTEWNRETNDVYDCATP
jgi:type VI protein secretion system component Hcp